MSFTVSLVRSVGQIVTVPLCLLKWSHFITWSQISHCLSLGHSRNPLPFQIKGLRHRISPAQQVKKKISFLLRVYQHELGVDACCLLLHHNVITDNDIPFGATFRAVPQEIVMNLKSCQVKQIQVVLHGVASMETITQPNDTWVRETITIQSTVKGHKNLIHSLVIYPHSSTGCSSQSVVKLRLTPPPHAVLTPCCVVILAKC